MNQSNFKRTKYACYFTYLAMSSVFALPPLLFATFKELYNISYTLLGSLVLVNFCTQLSVDLILSFLSKYFNLRLTIRIMPLVTAAGLSIYALVPWLFPQYAYLGLISGTFVFSIAAGLCEVLVSPTIAALPSDNPAKDMSALHSLYGYGFVGVVLISTLFLQIIGNKYWMLLTLLWAFLPIIASIMLMNSPMPDMNITQSPSNAIHSKHRAKGILLCMGCIFLGACAENTMANWVSVYAEKALEIPKIWGDVLGMSLFAALLAITRTLYAKFGKNIFLTLVVSMSGSVVCYLMIALSSSAFLSLISCIALGIFTSMLWPGTLILMEERIPALGVTAYALMAAGGDLGASIAPQAMGIIVDKIALTEWSKAIADNLFLTSEQIGFKVGMIAVAILPAIGVLLLIYMHHYFKKARV